MIKNRFKPTNNNIIYSMCKLKAEALHNKIVKS